MKRLCSFEGCDRPATPKRGLCAAHDRQHRDGKTLAPLKVPLPKVLCAFPGCDRLRRASSGYCGAHEQQRLRGQDLVPLIIRPSNKGKKCAFFGCRRGAKKLGYCATHYTQRSRGLDLTPIQVRPSNKGRICSCAGCDRPVVANGYCRTHYYQHSRTGTTWPIARCKHEGCGRWSSASGYCRKHKHEAPPDLGITPAQEDRMSRKWDRNRPHNAPKWPDLKHKKKVKWIQMLLSGSDLRLTEMAEITMHGKIGSTHRRTDYIHRESEGVVSSEFADDMGYACHVNA